MLSAIVLAAGSSKRMNGINKLILPYKNKTIISTVVTNILAAGIEEVIVVVGYEAEKVKEALENLPVIIINNPDHEKGLTTSIQQGVSCAKGNGYMICLSDMVLITPEEYIFLKSSFEKQWLMNAACICVPRYKNEKGNPVIFSSWYKRVILEHGEMEGCKEIVQSNRNNISWVDMQSTHILEDIDYPGDYDKL